MGVSRRSFLSGTAAGAAAGVLGGGYAARASVSAGAAVPTVSAGAADAALERALARLVRRPDGPPGAAALVRRFGQTVLLRAGVAEVANKAPFRESDSMRMASVAKAFGGAVALSVAADGGLSLRDTIGKRLPGLPRAWSGVRLYELLKHTSGIPDFSQTEAFSKALVKHPLKPPSPRALLDYAPKSLTFEPGSRYKYSNSDNIIVALMVEAATGKSYESQLRDRVFGPLGLRRTSLPGGAALPAPLVYGYDVDPPKRPEDVTSVIAAGWSWASGGVVSTLSDASAFIRAYARGALTSPALHREQFAFRAGGSEPPGPGTNAAGMAIFRYQTSHGTMFGHTGNTLGYTHFAASCEAGVRSVVVSVNAQITPTVHPAAFADLREIYGLAVNAAFASG